MSRRLKNAVQIPRRYRTCPPCSSGHNLTGLGPLARTPSLRVDHVANDVSTGRRVMQLLGACAGVFAMAVGLVVLAIR